MSAGVVSSGNNGDAGGHGAAGACGSTSSPCCGGGTASDKGLSNSTDVPPGDGSDSDGDHDGEAADVNSTGNKGAGGGGAGGGGGNVETGCITVHQRQFMSLQLAAVKRGELKSMTVHPPHCFSADTVGLADFCIFTTHIWAPHVFFKDKGVPSQPPCPKHGFDGVVIRNGWTNLNRVRRISGVASDEFMLGSRHICNTCRSERAAAVAGVADHLSEDRAFGVQHCTYEQTQRRRLPSLSNVEATTHSSCT
jgi:hypothetical protein